LARDNTEQKPTVVLLPSFRTKIKKKKKAKSLYFQCRDVGVWLERNTETLLILLCVTFSRYDMPSYSTIITRELKIAITYLQVGW
jgi:hypothetical protein